MRSKRYWRQGRHNTLVYKKSILNNVSLRQFLIIPSIKFPKRTARAWFIDWAAMKADLLSLSPTVNRKLQVDDEYWKSLCSQAEQ